MLNGGFYSFFILALYLIFLTYIMVKAGWEQQRAQEVFYQKSPDVIVVFTGDEGRIAHALELVKRNPSAKLVISGVYEKNSFHTILVNQIEESETLRAQELLESSDVQVKLDYDSKNTIENVKETLELLEKADYTAEKILIISSDYHIYRIKTIFENIVSPDKSWEFYFDSVESELNQNTVKKLLKESLKIFRTWFLV